MKHTKKQENVIIYKWMGGGKQAPETAYESDQMLNLRQK